ncbi:hypothetical protein B7494_g2065 [Chlorociboria aeruginascens]|nr:hypothetical protein B7494_g2065 [Chlorociboria aeruginascens]
MPALNVTSVTSNALQVVCAWPVSGQYGPGSRVLYYVLVAACVFARKTEWLRNACLAAALIFPAVAALHGIVLAAVHINGAIDLDVYGAFQLCAIGILAAPVTVRLSRTYFYDPGRNTIFLWTGLILAGFLSLTVEFFRINTSNCTHDDYGNPISLSPHQFPYGNATCNLTCSVGAGATSPLRMGSANSIYVIPAPDMFTFGTAALLAAACSVLAILSLVSILNKILEVNWKSRFGNEDEVDRVDEPIEGTNGAIDGRTKGVNTMIKTFLGAVEIPVFGAAVLAILVIGERNFFSYQVRYQTEPIPSIGQWAPIVGTSLAVLGSLYILFIADEKEVPIQDASSHHHNCSMQEVGRGRSSESPHSVITLGATNTGHNVLNDGGETISQMAHTVTHSTSENDQLMRSTTRDAGGRRKVAKALIAVGNHIGTAAHDLFDDSEFKHGKALNFPEVPGEEYRSRTLPQIRKQYDQSRDTDGGLSPLPRSRPGSFSGSVASEIGVANHSTTPRTGSPRRPHSGTWPTKRLSFEQQNLSSPSSTSSTGPRLRQRQNMLEVPSPAHHSGQIPPIIVVSSEADASSLTRTLVPPSSESLPTPPMEAIPSSSSNGPQDTA